MLNEPKVTRKLRAILSADVKGYSLLMADDETFTIKTLKEYRSIMSTLIQEHNGRVVDAPGDNLLADFSSVVDAVECAVEIQRRLKTENDQLDDDKKLQYRIGVNIGDVVQDGDRIYGNGVNVAARIEGLAEPGGVCISRNAYDHISEKLNYGYEYLGEHSVKNIKKPVRVYKLLMADEDAGKLIGDAPKLVAKKWIWATAVLAIIVITSVVWQVYQNVSKQEFEPASIDEMAYPLPERPSIAVLAFDNMSGDHEQDYLGDALTDQIITTLSKSQRLFVIARNSTFSYKGKAVKVQQVAEELGVRYVLEGSVQKSGVKIRINTQLIDAITGHHIWAEKYDRELKEIFVLQDEIAMKIMGAVGAEVTIGKRAHILEKGTKNVEAYLKVLQGYEHLYSLGVESNLKARKLAEEAIAIDTRYSDAYFILGATHVMEVTSGTTKSFKKSLEESVRLFKKTLSLDDSHPLAIGALAYIYVVQKQWDKAFSQAQRGIELNPGMANPHLGTVLMYAGKYEESIEWYKRCVRLDPKGPAFYFVLLGNNNRCLGRYEEAIEYMHKAIDRQQDYFLPHLQLAAIYALTGRQEEAETEAATVLSITPTFSLKKFGMALPYKDQVCKERIIEGARKAGLPD